MMLLLAYATILIACAIAISIVYGSWRCGISPMPSSSLAKCAMLDLLPELQEGTIYELGAGWGSLAFPLADRYPQCQVIAYELSALPYLFCIVRQIAHPRANLTICRKDFRQSNLSGACAIVCYLYPAAMEQLEGQISLQLVKSCWIVSNTFALQHRHPVKTATIADLYNSTIYLYHYVP
jgi:hypothetical protein